MHELSHDTDTPLVLHHVVRNKKKFESGMPGDDAALNKMIELRVEHRLDIVLAIRQNHTDRKIERSASKRDPRSIA